MTTELATTRSSMAQTHARPPLSGPDWLTLAGYALAAHVAIVLSFALGFASEDVVAIWPAAGICAWVGIRYGWPVAIVVFVSHEGYSLLHQDGSGALAVDPLFVVANLGNALAYVVATRLYSAVGGTQTPSASVRTILAFLIVFAVSMSATSALVGCAALVFVAGVPLDAIGAIAWRWFFSDFSGVVLVTPALIALHAPNVVSLREKWAAFARELPVPLAVSAAVMLVVSAATYSMPDGLGQYPVVLLTMPLCIWLALKDTAKSSLLLLSMTTIGSLALVLIAVGDTSEASFLAVQLYGVVVMCTSLVLRATSAERTVALRQLSDERTRLEEKVAERTTELRALAETDALTGLSNRRSFEAALAQSFDQRAQDGAPDQLLYIDLDRFKVVNDTSGHAAGDALLQSVADVLRRNVRSADRIGRVGGDEFAILLRRCPDDMTLRIAEAIRADVAAIRLRWEDESHDIGASIGVASVAPERASVSDVRQLADAACFTAKNNGRDRVHVAGGGDRDLERHRGNMLWTQRIRDALAGDHFLLFGQRMDGVQRDSDKSSHVEVLLRLQLPGQDDVVAPGAFLPAAERYGLTRQIDMWVVDRLIRHLENSAVPTTSRYWVNLSGVSIGDDSFCDELTERVARANLPTGTINFEITETAAIRNIRLAREMMVRLHEFGVLFALDDFGTGLSSFEHLKRLPVDHIKIDGSFVRDVTTDAVDRVFVRAIIDVAKTMGLRVVAECVEDDSIRRAVAELGADFVQGFGIHRPEPLVQVEAAALAPRRAVGR